MKIFFAGSFNPFTKGHADIVNRLLKLGDSVVIGIGINPEKKVSDHTLSYNVDDIRRWISTQGYQEKVEVMVYRGLTAHAALQCGADCLARGVRNSSDFDFEYSLAAANRAVFGIETILLPADPSLSFLSSSLIRELEKYGMEEEAKDFLV